ncbi:hypothetical protein B566_EDAN013888 [Ephemera danica]|nr:hypothetical protein B566_EDAN013888 [Ephemera danica]
MVTYRASDVKLSWEHEDNEQNDSPFSPNHKHHGARTCGYIREGPQEDDDESEEDHDREKRQADNYEYTPTKTRCPLLLVADYRFYQEMGGASTKNTINYLISLIDRVHKIYNDTIWHDRAELDGFKGMGFVIKKIVVHSEPTRVRGGEAHYNMVRDKWDVFSREYSHKDFCLAHLFTDLKFEGGILGLAYVGSPRRNSVGGICTPGAWLGLHACFLFVRFSPCSLRSIRKVLQAKSGRCFSEPEESFCGNLRVEGDEECDIGLLGTDDLEPCCDKNCRLRRDQGASCSDKNSPCCQECQYMKSGTRCREAQLNTCEQESRCTGTSPDCPRSPPMSDGTACLDRGQCRHGKCVPFCETQGLQSCMCDTIGDACKRCCRMLLNVTCFAMEPQEILPSGTPCIHGFCNNGLCEKTIQDGVERFWDIIEDININRVLLFLKDNLVGTVLIVSYVDRRRRLEDAARWEWRTRDELLHPRDPPRRVIYARNIPTVSTSAPTPQSNQASQSAQATPLRRMHLSSLSAPLH